MFRAHRWEKSWTCKFVNFAKVKYNFTKLWCIFENTDKFLGRCTDYKVSEPPTNVTQVLVESYIPKLKDAVFPVASWKTGTVGGKLGDRYKTSSCFLTSVSQVSEYKLRRELKLRWAVVCPVPHLAIFSKFQQLSFTNMPVFKHFMDFFTSEQQPDKEPDMKRERRR